VSAELTPALLAAGSGSALMGGIYLHEHRRDSVMRASRVRLNLRFPVGVASEAAFAVLDGLAGLPHTSELIAEVAAAEGRIEHALWVPAASRPAAEAALRGPVGSLRLVASHSPAGRVTLALKLFVPTPSVLNAANAEAAARALLAGLAVLREGEQVVVRWALRPGKPARLPERERPSRVAREVERAWQRKTSVPGMFASGLVLVRAGSVARARELIEHVASSIRSRRGHERGLRITFERGNRSLAALPKVGRRSGWLSSAELLPLLGWPLGPDVIPGVEVGASRELPVPRCVIRQGRRLFMGRDGNGERPVALDATAARHHMAVVGPSGVGKSVLLARCILSDIERGYGGVVIDPKADMLDEVLRRVPAKDADRIVVLDPGDVRPTPGVALLSGGDPDLRTDVLLGALRSTSDAWGIRSDLYGRLALRTLSEIPGATLADMGRLFMEEPYRRAAVQRLRDPFLLATWQAFEALTPGAQAEHVQAPLARVMNLLSRPKVRAILASPEPKLDVARLLRERKWLLISLAPGVLGEAGATLVGAALMYVIWSAIEARVAIPPEKRRPLFVYVDELATLTNGVPFGFELLAERARGLGAGLSVALQTIGRVAEPTRSALMGNVATLISFRAGAEEAPRLARELPGLTAADVMALDRFHVAARIATGTGGGVVTVTGRTEPLSAETGQAEVIRERSAQMYGSEPAPLTSPVPAVEAPVSETPVGQKRRQP
jgi:hypothetical protein